VKVELATVARPRGAVYPGTDGATGSQSNAPQDLQRALVGRIAPHHRLLLGLQLRRLRQMDGDIAELDRQIDERLLPFRESHTRLMQIPGVDWVVATVLIAELGTDMSVFRGPGHIAAWAGVCPGNHESAGKRQHGRVRWGNVLLKTTPVEAASGADRTRGSYLKDKFHRLRARRGATEQRSSRAFSAAC